MPLCLNTNSGCDVGSYRPSEDYFRVEQAEIIIGSGNHSRLTLELDQLVAETRSPNWDGHYGEGVNPNSYSAAWRFIQNLPPGMPEPTLGIDPFGCVTFEWYASPLKLLLVSVHPDYRIDYAMSIGEAKAYGTEPFFGTVPDKVVELVRRICNV